MRPDPFVPENYNGDERFVRNKTDGLVWHRSKSRTFYADTDRSNIVYHANYLRYFELGRTSLMRDIAYSYKEIEENGYFYPIIEMGVNFYSPLYYDDPFWINTLPTGLERVRLQFDYVITHQETGQIVCKGFTRHCAINSSGRPVAVDEKTIYLWKNFPK